MKKSLVFFFLLAMFFVMNKLSAKNVIKYEDAVEYANNYILDFPEYQENIDYGISIPYEYNSTLKINNKFYNGGFLNKKEFEIINNNSSYLYSGMKYFTMTEESSSVYNIEDSIKLISKLTSSGSRITQYIKPGISITGSGTYTNPWVFIEKASLCAKNTYSEGTLNYMMLADNCAYPDNVASEYVEKTTGIDFLKNSDDAPYKFEFSTVSVSSQTVSGTRYFHNNVSFDEETGIASFSGETGSFKNGTYTSLYTDLAGYYFCNNGSKNYCGNNNILYKIETNNPSSFNGLKITPVVKERIQNGNGLYYTTDDKRSINGERVYYYRGSVVNNNVIFANFCWRIIRINEDGNIRLRYNGTPTNGKCPATGTVVSIGSAVYNTPYNSNTYVGYMYGNANGSTYELTHSNLSNSNIKNVLENWYQNNLLSYSSKIADSIFCNDRSVGNNITNPSYIGGTGISTSSTLYGSERRTVYTGQGWGSEQEATYNCINQNDRFTVSSSIGNGKLTYPIGLITGDEVAFAGGSRVTNQKYYLRTGGFYTTMSPSYFRSDLGSGILYVGTNGDLYGSTTTYSSAILPVISLVKNVEVSSGNGTYNTPYIINNN
jgi:hypothetical protein